MSVITSIQFRRGTAAQWTTANPILAAGEFGWESDTGEFKIGNGATAWNSRPYWISDVAAHTHPASQISDSTAVGRSVMTAVDATAARTAIGAGTSSLAIGTTGTTAMAGNTTFAFSQITGTLGTAQLPPLAVNEVFAPADQTAMLALTAQRGDIAIRVDNGKTYILSTDSPATLADWKIITAVGDVSSVAGRTGAVVLAKADVGLGNVDNTSDVNKPVSTAQATSIATKEPTIAAGTTAQYYRGDKSWQTLDKTAAGLANVDNTSDASKPVSTAQATALAGKEATVAAGTTAQYYRGDKTWATLDKTAAGLANVDNTSDVNKPVSTAQATSIATKEPTIAAGTTAQYYRGDKTWQPSAAIVLTTVDGGTP